jgi:predicted GNAT superfamily acetyltransferase
MDTPARRATSRMLTAAGRLFGGLVLGAFTDDAIVRFPAVSQAGLRGDFKHKCTE